MTVLKPEFWTELFGAVEAGEIPCEVACLIGYVAATPGGRVLSRRGVTKALGCGNCQALRHVRQAVGAGWIVEDPDDPGHYVVARGWLCPSPERQRSQSGPVGRGTESGTQARVVPIRTAEGSVSPDGGTDEAESAPERSQSGPPPAESGSESGPGVVPIRTTTIPNGTDATITQAPRRFISRAAVVAEWRKRKADRVAAGVEQEKLAPVEDEVFAPGFEVTVKGGRP